jgi:glycosyltransferase involved in cell wall biosynthesis
MPYGRQPGKAEFLSADIIKSSVHPSFPLISVIVPCLDERFFIGPCLDSILANDYPRFEILVIDGMSTDGTTDIILGYAARHKILRFLKNPRRITPVALNIGIRESHGDIVIRMDAHATYEQQYISKCVAALIRGDADNVGGVWKILPRSETVFGKAIVAGLTHQFGVGNSYFRLGSDQPRYVDAVPYFCMKRETLKDLGPFSEDLVRTEDMEFNLRLKKRGGRTLLDPTIVSEYYARSDMWSFWKHNWINGVWAILPFLYSTVCPVTWRHLVPLFFVLSLISALTLSMIWPQWAALFYLIAGFYILSAALASLHIAYKIRDVRYVFAMPLVFGSLHIGYGVGSVWGCLKGCYLLLLSSPRQYQQVAKSR